MSTKPTNSMQKSLFLSLAAVAGALLPGASSSQAALAYGLTADGLVAFDTDAPSSSSGSVFFSGLSGGDVIVDIDFRPSDGQLYGMASTGRVYTINPSTGAATVNTSAGVGLLGVVTAADFNPVADRLRVLSEGDVNSRLTPGTGVYTNDGTFSYSGGLPNPNLGSAAYTHSFQGVTAGIGTTLYSIDIDTDSLVIHSVAPQFSSLTAVGALNFNGLGINFGVDSGFDIYSTGQGFNTGYLTNGNTLYEVDLTNCDLTELGAIGGAGSVTSLAVVPEPTSLLLAGLPIGLLALRRKRQA